MKKSTKRILSKLCSAGIMDSVSDFIKGKPSINKKDVPAFEKFQKQSKALLDMLNKAKKDMESLGLEGNWGQKDLDTALEHLKNFVEALNIQPKITYDKPTEEIK